MLCYVMCEKKKKMLITKNEVLRCKTSQASLTFKIMGYTSSRNAPALAWGNNNEKLAREAFTLTR